MKLDASQMAINIFNDVFAGVLGFWVGHCIANNQIYKQRQYVLQRIYFENSQGIQYRNKLLRNPGEMFNEYPIRNPQIITDAEIIQNRISPEEYNNASARLKYRVDKDNEPEPEK